MNQPPESDRSHEFQFGGRALARLLAPTLAGIGALVAILQLFNVAGWLPPRKPALTGDEFVMRNRMEIALSRDPAEVLIIGDSSSVMGVDAAELQLMLPGKPPVYNLGLFLGLPMEAYAEAAQKFIGHHPGQVRMVILLTTFARLADADPANPSLAYWRSVWERDQGEPAPDRAGMDKLLLITRLQESVLTRVVPFERHGQMGVFYGGIVQARHFVAQHRGAAFSQGVYNRQGSTEQVRWRLDPGIFAQARQVRELIPEDIRLGFGIMAMPETYAGPDADVHRREMMREVNVALGAEVLLETTPATLPDAMFADLVHLNRRGQEHFTRLLAAELAKLPVWDSDRDPGRP